MSESTIQTPVRIAIYSERYEIAGSLFSDVYGDLEDVSVALSPADEMLMGVFEDGFADEEKTEPAYFVKPSNPAVLQAKMTGEKSEALEKIDMFTEGRMSIIRDPDSQASTVAILYQESELTGMEGATSTITYRTDDRGLVTMLRSGSIKTALTFRAHHRTICTYDTPYMPFQIGIHALTVHNRLDTEGELILDYLIEIKGGVAERCTMRMVVKPAVGDSE